MSSSGKEVSLWIRTAPGFAAMQRFTVREIAKDCHRASGNLYIFMCAEFEKAFSEQLVGAFRSAGRPVWFPLDLTSPQPSSPSVLPVESLWLSEGLNPEIFVKI
jgi:hypothetical protein